VNETWKRRASPGHACALAEKLQLAESLKDGLYWDQTKLEETQIMKTLTYVVLTSALTLLVSVGSASAQAPQTSETAHAKHVLLSPAELQWTDAGPALPPGAQVALLEGDPKQPGPFTIRFKAPDGYKIPPHFHPAVEHVTIISGTLGMGMGEQFDPGKGKELAAGGFGIMPAGMRHFAWTKGETVIQVHGVGPWGITYVNPADDPRKKSGQ
jgi:quercetin dioxygenase-like cupin family protein